MKFNAKLELSDYIELKTELGLNPGGRIQQFIDQFVLFESIPYEPGRHIHNQGVIATNIGSGKVIWDSPDANYLYEGKLMVDPITLKGAFYNPNYGYWSRPRTQKIMDPKGRWLKLKKGESHWVEKMLEDKMEKLIDGIEKRL